jgi:hypothetical protein
MHAAQLLKVQIHVAQLLQTIQRAVQPQQVLAAK